MPLYTPVNVIMAVATVRRDHAAPIEAIRPDVKVSMGQRVSPDDVLVAASRAGQFRTLSLLDALKVRRAADIKDAWILVTRTEVLDQGQVIAQRSTRGPKLVAPVNCVVVSIDAGQVVIQDNPETISVQALYPGVVTGVGKQATVQVESYGVIVQCAWGNGKSVFGAYVQEPEGGLRPNTDVLNTSSLRGQLLWINRRVTPADLKSGEQEQIRGIIAPGMPSALIPAALAAPFPIVLTEGFGTQQHSDLVYGLLRNNLGRQIAIDAAVPDETSLKRPELFVPVTAGGMIPPVPLIDRPLSAGLGVRITREPLIGLTGRIEQVAETPQIVDNELRLPGATVQLKDGRRVFVPAANLEVIGQIMDN